MKNAVRTHILIYGFKVKVPISTANYGIRGENKSISRTPKVVNITHNNNILVFVIFVYWTAG